MPATVGIQCSHTASGRAELSPHDPASFGTRVAMEGDFILVGGSFSSPHNNLIRLHHSGLVDYSFGGGQTPPNGSVRAIRVQKDGKVLIGGSFTGVGGISRGRIARLHPDGTPGRTFGEEMSGANGDILSIGVQEDGKMVVAGAFTSIRGHARNRIARLNPDGSLDLSFAAGLSGANATIRSVSYKKTEESSSAEGSPMFTVKRETGLHA